MINKSSGREIKAINIVHVFGNPANMERLIDIAREYGLKVIEDATEALGSYYSKGRYAGRYVWRRPAGLVLSRPCVIK